MKSLDAETVQQLVRTNTGGRPVVSFYLNVDGRKNVRVEDYCKSLEALMRRARKQSTDKSVEADLERIENYVRNEFLRGNSRGLVIFAASDALWKVVVLPLPVEDYVVVDRVAHVQRLEYVLDEYQPTGVLLADKQRARLMVIELGRVVERDEVVTPRPRHDDDKGDWEKDHVKQHASAITQQHLKAAAQGMFDLYQRRNFRHLVIGTSLELSSELQQNLHDYLSQRIVGVAQIGISASDEEVVAIAWELTQAAERAEERVLIDRLQSLLSNSGSAKAESAQAVAGLAASLRVITEKRAETLLVSSGFSEEGYRCAACGQLATTSEDKCPLCSSKMEKCNDVVESAVEQALAQKCRVEFCHDAPELNELGGIGAILRF